MHCTWCPTVSDSDVPQYFAGKVEISSISMKKMFIRLIFCDFNMATEHTVMTICGTIEKLCFGSNM